MNPICWKILLYKGKITFLEKLKYVCGIDSLTQGISPKQLPRGVQGLYEVLS